MLALNFLSNQGIVCARNFFAVFLAVWEIMLNFAHWFNVCARMHGNDTYTNTTLETHLYAI